MVGDEIVQSQFQFLFCIYIQYRMILFLKQTKGLASFAKIFMAKFPLTSVTLRSAARIAAHGKTEHAFTEISTVIDCIFQNPNSLVVMTGSVFCVGLDGLGFA